MSRASISRLQFVSTDLLWWQVDKSSPDHMILLVWTQALVKLPYWHISEKEMEVIYCPAYLKASEDAVVDVFFFALA